MVTISTKVIKGCHEIDLREVLNLPNLILQLVGTLTQGTNSTFPQRKGAIGLEDCILLTCIFPAKKF